MDRWYRIRGIFIKRSGIVVSEKVVRRIMQEEGLVVSWSIGISPSADLVNTMLDVAISLLNEGEHPIVHNDRGAHYR